MKRSRCGSCGRDAAVQPYLPALLDYLNTWNQQTPDLYFCEEGLLQFVRTGRCLTCPGSVRTAGRRDAPGAAAAAAPAAASDKQTLRIVESAQRR